MSEINEIYIYDAKDDVLIIILFVLYNFLLSVFF